MIPYDERKAVYENAIAHYGMRSQIGVAVEEMAELTKELARLDRHEGTTLGKLIDEIADVTIMLEQLRLMFNVNQPVQDRIDYKVERLVWRMEKENQQEG